jgi:hypothetical protein
VEDQLRWAIPVRFADSRRFDGFSHGQTTLRIALTTSTVYCELEVTYNCGILW